ncbi:MAG: efflux RND transporter permease subunit [Candidatus Hydrogenedentes bacterium]|nr:efflux RND transporter permease subunit [Candidatus Hydrogenedentota bacterium]
MRNFMAAFARNKVFANILLLMFLGGGFIAARNMVRETFPDFSLDYIAVSVIWPGADPEEVEEGVCRKVEEAIEGVEGVKQYRSTSSENSGTVIVEVSADADMAYVKEQVRNRVEAISTFPPEAERPITEEILLRQEVMFVALSGEQLTERQLKEWGETVEEELRLLPEISQVQTLGAREYEIGIEVSEERLREYGLTFDQVAGVVRASNLNLSAGSVRTEGEEIRLRTIGRKYTGQELSKIVVMARPNGDIITLDRIAAINDGFTQDRIISRMNGQPAINVAVLKTTDEDSIAISDAVKAYVERRNAQLPEGIQMTIWADDSNLLRQRISLLVNNGITGLLLVFVLLWLFLDIRLSFWVSMGMPISISGALVILWSLGATINMISLFGLIMVLGVIVDDAIVMGEAIYTARKNGAGPLEAAVDGASEVGMPVIASLTTTVMAFIPLFFVDGLMGRFIAILPTVVVSCLTISLLECMFCFPAHLNNLPAPEELAERRRNRSTVVGRLGDRIHGFTNHGMEWFVEHVYEPFLTRVLRFRYISFCIAVAMLLLTLGLVQSGIIKFEVFPSLDSDQLTASVEFPNGTPLAVTEVAVSELEDAIRRLAAKTTTQSGDPLIINMFTLVGQEIVEGPPRNGNHIGAVRVELLGSEKRGIYFEELMAQWEAETDQGKMPGITALSFNGLETGPPGAPVEIWVRGHDLPTIRAASDRIKTKLESYDGLYQVQDDFRPGKTELRLTLKEEARALGMTVAGLATQVYAGYFGEEAVRLQRGRDDIRVRVRYTEEERGKIAEFERVRVRTPQGLEVPLLSVANIEYGPGVASINRSDGMRRIAVTCDVDTSRANAAEVVAELENNFFPALLRDYPAVDISFQGEKLRQTESLDSLATGYPLALMGILVIIAASFGSYLQPLVIMITVPFGIIGALLAHLFLGYTLSMMSFFGMVAMSGVVVNDAIVLIECINSYLAKGEPFLRAVSRGGARRFRAIFLTTITTVGGLGPLILERDIQAQFLVPMAISIAGGVGFATLLTLLLIPCLLIILNDLRRVVRYFFTKEWPTREEVEPAVQRGKDDLSEGYEPPVPLTETTLS